MTVSPELTKIYFSDFFGVPPEVLEDYGAFNVSLINDLPLFVDPFLIFNSDDLTYRQLHKEIVRYVVFLRNKSLAGRIPDGLLKAWFTFSEVKENWLGYSLSGNKGTGLGMDFARALNASLATRISDFGSEEITKSSHIEKVCLVSNGVGKDNISDFVTNLIKGYLLEYTQTFAGKFLSVAQRKTLSVEKAVFNYDTETWETRQYDLPFVDNEFILLTPTDLLTKDEVWINRTDMVEQYTTIASAVDDDQLRAQVNNYFWRVLNGIQERDEEKRRRKREAAGKRRKKPPNKEPNEKQVAEAAVSTYREFPTLIDYFIRWKEEHGDEAEAQADEKVRSSERLYIGQVRAFASYLLENTPFYGSAGATLEEARARVEFLKDVIENKGGWRLFYSEGEPIRRESDLQILFRLTWCNTPSDVNREVNNGRGPSDFEISRGSFDKSLVEFKLAKNTALARNLEHQVEIYKAASDAQHALKVIVFFTQQERERAVAIIRGLGFENDPHIILIDARSDNKPSASKADFH
ncbi:MAG: hypothetical protein MCM46_15515 [Candidatus Manganitrophus sp. SB1]|nr:hypothetical protein [Candidatus Manganitrophus morganii]